MTNSLIFHVEPTKNALDGITLYEPIDRAVLVKLINSTLLKETFNNKMAGVVYKTEKQQLQRYLNMMEGGRVPITYSRNPNNPYGRSNPAHAVGLYPIRREIRHTLAKTEFVDLDVKNCHPEMLNQLCEAEGVPHDKLDHYVKNRQQHFDEVVKSYGCDEESAKTLFIMYSYGGGFKKWVEKSKIKPETCDPHMVLDGVILELATLREFRESMRIIHSKIEKKNPALCDVVRSLKAERGQNEGSYNLAGSVCSFVLQEYEIRVLEKLFLYCSDKGLIENGVCVLCADGLMIERRFYDETLLSKFTDLIKETLGFSLVFTQKEMTKDYLAILDKRLAFDLYTPAYATGLIAEHFAVIYSNKFVCRFGEVFRYNGVVWEPLDKKNSALSLFVDDKFYKYMVGYCAVQLTVQNQLLGAATTDEEKQPIENTLKNISDLLKGVQLLRKGKSRKELVDDIINQITNNTIVFNLDPNLFAFNNKIYDLKTNKFVPPKYTQYISTTCGYDYVDYYPQARVKCYGDLIDTILPDPLVRDYYLTVLATGLYGQQIENFFVATGTGGNGKSLLNSQMMETVGDYGYKLGSNVLLDVIKEGANPAIASLNRKRFVLVQEPDGKKRICTATLKEITGDKTINARQLYSGECKTTLNLSLVMECNELPALDEVGGGVERRVRAVPFDSRFVPKDTYDSLEDKSGLGIANPHYKTSEFQQLHRQALFAILLPYWAKFQRNGYSMPELPAPCKVLTKDYMAMSDDIYGWFSETYEKGDETSDLVYIDEMLQCLKVSPMYSQMTKKDQRDLTAKKFNEKVEKNIFLRQYYKARDTRVNKKKLNKPAICGFKKRVLITTSEEEEEGDIDFDEV